MGVGQAAWLLLNTTGVLHCGLGQEPNPSFRINPTPAFNYYFFPLSAVQCIQSRAPGMLGKCSNTELHSHNLTVFIQLKKVGAVSRPPPIVTDYWGSKLGM